MLRRLSTARLLVVLLASSPSSAAARRSPSRRSAVPAPRRRPSRWPWPSTTRWPRRRSTASPRGSLHQPPVARPSLPGSSRCFRARRDGCGPRRTAASARAAVRRRRRPDRHRRHGGPISTCANTAYRSTCRAPRRRAVLDEPTRRRRWPGSTRSAHAWQRRVACRSVPTNVAGRRPTPCASRPKHDGGLLGAAALAWDAAHGHAAARRGLRRGNPTPVLELRRPTSASARSRLRPRRVPPAGRRSSTSGCRGRRAWRRLHGEPAPVAPARCGPRSCRSPSPPPTQLAGLPRKDVRLIDAATQGRAGHLRRGLGAIAVLEQPRAAESGPCRQLPALPKVSLNGAAGQELATALGTAVRFASRRRPVHGPRLPPAAAAEAAARASVGRCGSAPPVEARGLVKRYGDVIAVDDVDLTVYPGDVFGYLGPNGAGRPRRCGCCWG